MNCRRVERLIALRVGGDITPESERAVAEHLRGCEGCRRSAPAFAASRALLDSYEPPEFDPTFFDSVRRNVMREIEKAPAPRRLALFADRLLGRRSLAHAFALALAVAVGLVGLKVFNERGDVVNRQTANANSAGAELKAGKHISADSAPEAITPHQAGRQGQPRQVAKQQQRRAGAAPQRAVKLQVNVPAHAATPELVSGGSEMERLTNDVTSDAVEEVAFLEGRPAVESEPKMLRIELQTGDPNVRIIWLSPQSSEVNTKK